jgi:hypothetical protein
MHELADTQMTTTMLTATCQTIADCWILYSNEMTEQYSQFQKLDISPLHA